MPRSRVASRMGESARRRCRLMAAVCGAGGRSVARALASVSAHQALFCIYAKARSPLSNLYAETRMLGRIDKHRCPREPDHGVLTTATSALVPGTALHGMFRPSPNPPWARCDRTSALAVCANAPVRLPRAEPAVRSRRDAEQMRGAQPVPTPHSLPEIGQCPVCVRKATS